MFRKLGRVIVVPASVLAVSALSVPYAAADDHNPPGSFGTSQSGSSSNTFTGTQTHTHVSPGGSGSSGTSSSGSSAGGSSSSDPTSGLWLNNSGGSACDPSLYPNGYSADFALPSPCIQPTPGQQPQAPAAPVITTQMVTDAAKVTAPLAPPHVEPGDWSFVHIPNNYWTDAPTVQTSVNVLGRNIPLTWTPTGTTWTFGDGSTATGNGVEGAGVGEAGAIEHAYTRQGSYDITTSTTYDLTFVLPGQGQQTVALTSPPSPPVTLLVSEIQTRVDYAR